MSKINDLFARAIGNYLIKLGFLNIENKHGGFYKYKKNNIIVTVPLFRRNLTCIFVQFGKPCEKIKQNFLFDKKTSRLNFITKLRDGFRVEEEFKKWFENLIND
jgi:predicted RNA binding protein YcfA (HicA-like mRNA interferase family)